MSDDPKITKALVGFYILRAASINAYASYEQSLAMLFNTLMGNHGNPIGIQKSFLVFAQLFVYRTRRQMLTELVKKEHPERFDIFLKSLLKRLSKLDGDRNKVVHWIALVSTTGGKNLIQKMT